MMITRGEIIEEMITLIHESNEREEIYSVVLG